MNNNHDESRRSFLKHSAQAAVGITLIRPYTKNVWATQSTWTNQMPVNPEISNLRVAHVTDSSMVTGSTVSWDYNSQNKNISISKVSDNIDKMAIALAQKGTAEDAWKTIFRKPSAKTWDDVKVAIKVNTQASGCMPRHAVVVKVCNALIDSCGVIPSNICIYSCKNITHSANLTKVEDSYGLTANLVNYPFPAGVKIKSNLFSGNYSAKVQVPGGAVDEVSCLNDLVDGTVDILVNIAVNKGHYQAGAVTLCQKNHIGSLKFFCPGQTASGQSIGRYTSGSCTDLIALNKTAAIVGGDPIRQQLCIVDSIFGMKGGPVGVPDKQLDTLVMGTFAGAVDFLTYWKVREPAGYTSTRVDDINSFITGYGYSTTDSENLINQTPENNNGNGWVDALTYNPETAVEKQTFNNGAQRSVALLLQGTSIATVLVPQAGVIEQARIVNLQGKIIHSVSHLKNSANISRLLISHENVSLSPGMYQLVVEGAHFKQYANFVYVR